MFTITKRYDWIAAHRIEGHDKCGRMHGHNYMLDVTVGVPQSSRRDVETVPLNASGFIIDFADLSRVVKDILEPLDHRYMVSEANQDANCPWLAAAVAASLHDSLVYVPVQQSSAEMLAMMLKDEIEVALYKAGYTTVAVMEVTVWETPKASATF